MNVALEEQHHLVHIGQTEAEALHVVTVARVHAVELVENLLQVALGNAQTVVADGNHEMTVFVPGLDGQMQRHTLAAVLHGIVHQIIYNVREVHFVHTDFCLLRVQMSLYLAAVLTHLQREGLYHAT